MWVSLKMLEEEDLIFMNSICCCSYFWSFKRFPGHQQKLPNTSGALCTLMTCWVRSPANAFVWATYTAIISPSGFRVRMMERKKTSPQIATKTHRVKFWIAGIMMSTGQDFTPKPYLPSASQIQNVFLSMDFFIATGKLLQEQGGPDAKNHLHTERENYSLCLLQMLLCLCCRGIGNISIYTWILPNFNHL